MPENAPDPSGVLPALSPLARKALIALFLAVFAGQYAGFSEKFSPVSSELEALTYGQLNPSVIVEDLIAKLVEVIVLYRDATGENGELKAGKKDEFIEAVRGVLLPRFAVRRITYGVMGKEIWNEASPQQRKSLETAMIDSLFASYAEILLRFKDEKIVVAPAEDPGPNARSARVKNGNTRQKRGQLSS